LKKLTVEKSWTNDWDTIDNKVEELEILLDLAKEENDAKTFNEISNEIEQTETLVENLELKQMLGNEDDIKNAILTIHPGAGGTESHDWAEMLFRMYLRYAQKQGFATDVLDLQTGEEAGIKSVTVEIKGEYAYGYLQAEAGVHRLVRISPFDANKRRHTSFASVFVYPEIEENIEVIVDPNDLRIDTYRASGAGGQHVNKTSSAIRITHIPTGTVVQCQNERSQHQNKANAMKILMSKLYQLKKEEEDKTRKKILHGEVRFVPMYFIHTIWSKTTGPM
jgi:peptide chain release factor 2